MTRDFFLVSDGGEISADVEGQEFSTPESAWTEAGHAAAEMARDKTINPAPPIMLRLSMCATRMGRC